MVLQKELCKIYEDFGTEEVLKAANDDEQTDLEGRYLPTARQTLCITLKQ